MRFVGVIPARYASSRLPGKPLIEIAGKTLVQWTYEQASKARCLHQVVVATDDERVSNSVQACGGEVMMTRSDHLSGTDRVVEVAQAVQADAFLNLQCDEPQIAPETICCVCEGLEQDPDVEVSTARVPILDLESANDPHAVKVVVDRRNRALYFSRSRIPYSQDNELSCFKHLGIYAYRRSFLLALSPQRSRLERLEKLEQLRWLENGVRIHVATVEEDSIGVDTGEDLERVRPLLENTAEVKIVSQGKGR